MKQTSTRIVSSMLAAAMLLTCPASMLGLPDITYPTYLPFNQDDQKIDVRKLPFAVRGAYPEFIGSALSAAYEVPHIDSADLPKDINLISSCGITISTVSIEPTQKAGRMPVELRVDLSGLQKPDYIPFEMEAIINAVAQAVAATLNEHLCEVESLVVTSLPEQEAFAQIITSEIPHQQRPNKSE